jgi:putative transposase
MCDTLELSTSGYYEWLDRPPSARAIANAHLVEEMREVHRFSRQTYGRPRMSAELRDRGRVVNHKRVGRLMSEHGIVGATRRRKWRTTKRDRNAAPAPDLVERKFDVNGPDQLWVADITYIPTWAGVLFLAVVVDAWSRRVVGWAMETHLRTELVLQALNMALYQRRPEQVIHHSDQGTQYTSIQFGLRCKEARVRPSMGSVGDAYDNALCESFFATLECELLDPQRFQNQAEAKMACSTSSRAGTTRTGGIPPSDRSHPSTSKRLDSPRLESTTSNCPDGGVNSRRGWVCRRVCHLRQQAANQADIRSGRSGRNPKLDNTIRHLSTPGSNESNSPDSEWGCRGSRVRIPPSRWS